MRFGFILGELFEGKEYKWVSVDLPPRRLVGVVLFILLGLGGIFAAGYVTGAQDQNAQALLENLSVRPANAAPALPERELPAIVPEKAPSAVEATPQRLEEQPREAAPVQKAEGSKAPEVTGEAQESEVESVFLAMMKSKTPRLEVTGAPEVTETIIRPKPVIEVSDGRQDGDRFIYVYQVASFKELEPALRFVDEVAKLGLESRVESPTEGGWRRVSVQLVAKPEETKIMKDKLSALGVDKPLLVSKQPL